MDVLIIMALILVPVTALLSFLGYKFISYYEIVSEPPSIIKWVIGTVAVYIALMTFQLLRLLLGGYGDGFGGSIMGGNLDVFIVVALIFAPIFIFASYLARIEHHKVKRFAPISVKTWLIMTVIGYVIMLIATAHYLSNMAYVYVTIERG